MFIANQSPLHACTVFGVQINGNLIEQELRDFLSVTYLQALRDADAQLNYGRGSRLSQILLNTSNISEKGEMEGIIDILSKASKAILEKNSIKTTKDVITEKYLKNLILSDEKLNAEISMIGTTSSEEMNDNLQRRVLKNILEKLSLNFDSNLKQGLGYNNLLFIAAELLLLSSSINSGQKTLLIEEPEAHLHPQLQLRLLEFLNSKSKENVQMFISSHSPNIASKVPLKNIFILNKGNVLSLRKDETGLAEEDYIFLEKFLDVTKSNLFFAKGVILVEGTSEEILLPSIARAIDYPLENYGISIVNIGNTAFKRYAKIFHRTTENESIGIKVACVRDLDLKPIKADEEKFPNIGFIKRKNEDTWLKETKQEIENQIETKMEKLKKDLENQDVKVFVSDVWTFEYSLIHNGMNNSIFSLYKNSLKVDTYDDLAEDDEEKAIKLFSKIHKTGCAYQLTNIIDATPSDYSEKTFPKYICDAIKYVIGVSDDKR